jgi:NADH dehydrogenase FAD-containing subunit
MTTPLYTGSLGMLIINIYHLAIDAVNANANAKPKPDVNVKPNIVVIGYGWGGKNFCDNIDYMKYNVTVVSNTKGMLDTTLLKHINANATVKLTLPTIGSQLSMVNRECTGINTIKKQVNMSGGLILPYDYLVLAVGAVTNDFNIPGVKEHCYFLKTVDDHTKLLSKLKLKSKSLSEKDPVVVLGAGPTGVELAFELSKAGYNVTLVDAMPTILPSFSREIAGFVSRELRKYGVNLLLNVKITNIDKDFINGNIPYKVSIWTCGIKANPLIREITKSHVIPVNDNLQLITDPSIYAIGDIIAYGPPTAQKAKQQGIYLADKFNNGHECNNPFVFKEYIKLIHTRDYTLVDVNNGIVFRIPRIN